MLLLQCNSCGSTATVDCQCPPEMQAANLGFHHQDCPFTDLGANVQCRPGSDCCAGDVHPGLSHDAHANACPANHAGQPCPVPASCPGWEGHKRDVANLAGTAAALRESGLPHEMAAAAQYEGVKAALEQAIGQPVEGDCPGGHCAVGVNGCQVCRPISITVLAGSVVMRPASPGA